MKRILLIAATLILFSLLFIFLDKNKIEVVIDEKIESDISLFLKDPITGEQFTIFENKKLVNYIPNFYGENDWLLKVEGIGVKKFRHFKTSSSNNHSYLFSFSLDEKSNSIVCKINIKGTDDISQFFVF